MGLLFLSTPSARRATHGFRCERRCGTYFYPRPPRGGRRVVSERLTPVSYFYPRPPRGGRPLGDEAYTDRLIFLSTPSARRATRNGIKRLVWSTNFYPRPPRGGRRTQGSGGSSADGFLSTPSARRATSLVNSNLDLFLFLSTPSARRATRRSIQQRQGCEISIHALREEGDHRPPFC